MPLTLAEKVSAAAGERSGVSRPASAVDGGLPCGLSGSKLTARPGMHAGDVGPNGESRARNRPFRPIAKVHPFVPLRGQDEPIMPPEWQPRWSPLLFTVGFPVRMIARLRDFCRVPAGRGRYAARMDTRSRVRAPEARRDGAPPWRYLTVRSRFS